MSSSEAAVEVRGISKQYRISHRRVRAGLVEWLAGGWRRRADSSETFYAVNDVSFDVARGEVVAFIGHNGAGKSTLLKILSRIVEPTSGEARVRGTLGSLLEVGTGFHPELTGRENVFLNGAILGMRRHEVQRRFDEIVEFSGVERFLDTPVKRYSSGMYVRLAFAVAAHLDADILIVDEVLAVGDEEFQKKCLTKMGDVVGVGRTVLFVSHNMSAVATLARRTLVFERGKLAFDGPTADATSRYLGQSMEGTPEHRVPARDHAPTITRVALGTSQGGRTQAHGEPLDVIIEVAVPGPFPRARLAVTICDRLGRPCAYAWIFDTERPFLRQAGVHQWTCRFHRIRLLPGDYSVRLELSDNATRWQVLQQTCAFSVLVFEQNHEGGWPTNDVVYVEDADWALTPTA